MMPDNNRQKLVFFLETKWPVGGSQIMFIELGSYIAENYPTYDAYYINNGHPDLEKIYGSKKLPMLDVDKVDFSKYEGAIFVTPYNYIFELMIRIRKLKDARILLYFYHQEIMTWLNNQMRSPIPDMCEFIELMRSHNSYSFMDRSCFNSIVSRLPGMSFNTNYVPVPVKNNPFIESKPLINNGKLNIGWLGRLDIDKIYSVLNLAENLVNIDDERMIDLHIIGDGSAKSVLDVNKYSPKIRFIFTSNLYGEVRDEYIRENIDIMVAMGMSATDTSQLKIPTVFPIVSPHEFNDNKFIYIFDTTEFAIGWDPTEINGSGCKMYTIDEVIKHIYSQNKKEEYGELCCDYAKNVFSLENSSSHLIDLLDGCKLTVSDCNSCKPIKKVLKRYDRFVKFTGRQGYEAYHDFSSKARMDVMFSMGIGNFIKNSLKFLLSVLRGRKDGQ